MIPFTTIHAVCQHKKSPVPGEWYRAKLTFTQGGVSRDTTNHKYKVSLFRCQVISLCDLPLLIAVIVSRETP
mgnify:FL=1|jgi:hypothetical protein